MNKLSVNNSIPKEFPKIFHDYEKAVIRYNPKDIIDFSYKYFYCLENGIPLISIYSPKISTELSNSIEINSNKKETVQSTIDHNDINFLQDKEKMNNNNVKEMIEKNDSKKITSNNNSSSSQGEDEEEDEKDSNNLEDSTILLPSSKEMAEVIRKRKEEERKNRLDSTFSRLSESDSQKQGIIDFVSDLFFESDDRNNDK